MMNEFQKLTHKTQQAKPSGFITYGTGFTLHFDSGWEISCQWGGGTFSDNRTTVTKGGMEVSSKVAEVRVTSDLGVNWGVKRTYEKGNGKGLRLREDNFTDGSNEQPDVGDKLIWVNWGADLTASMGYVTADEVGQLIGDLMSMPKKGDQ